MAHAGAPPTSGLSSHGMRVEKRWATVKECRPHGTSQVTVPDVTGEIIEGGEGQFVGELSNLTAVNDGGVPTLTGTITDLATGESQEFSAPIQGMDASDACDILNLDLGPLHLDVLGLVVDLEPVVLDITAERGPGNLLGNLLCAVAGLFDNLGHGGGSGGLGGVVNGIVNILNRLLSGLGL